MDRRAFLSVLAGAAGALMLPAAQAGVAGAGFDLSSGVRAIDLYRPATRERLHVAYLNQGVWVPDAYPKLCWLLRDHKANEYVRMDPALIAILDWTQRYLRQYGYTGPLHILSGFRTQRTNQNTEGAKKNSQHLYGKAVDFRVPGLSADYLGKLMAWLSQGGVGVYAKDDFVHVDTGTVRIWHEGGRAPRLAR